MLNTPRVRNLYSKIQNQIFNMVPEKWDKLYLYASVIEQINNLETGEMFFYYYPKGGLIKKNPVNAYEVPNKFNVDEDAYMKLADRLYNTIKQLRKEYIIGNEKVWSNITISIENFKFKAKFGYEDLLYSKYSNYERHLIWKYEYLGLQPEMLNRKERKILEQYQKERELEIPNKGSIYTESIYDKPIQNKIEYNTKAQENNVIDPTRITDFTLPNNRQVRKMSKKAKALMEKRKLELPEPVVKKKENENIEIIKHDNNFDIEQDENVDIIHDGILSPLDEEIVEISQSKNFILQAPNQQKKVRKEHELEHLADKTRKRQAKVTNMQRREHNVEINKNVTRRNLQHKKRTNE